MLLTIDIGNTNVTIGIFDGEKLVKVWRLASDIHRMPDEYAAMMLKLFEHQGLCQPDITDVALCSTVPPLISSFEQLIKEYFSITPLTVGPGVKTKVRILMDNPREVGADRIVNCVAAHHLYHRSAIVVDVGTATTFDVVSRDGDYMGGAIAPGIAIGAEALFQRAAALPRIQLTRPKKAIGTNTITAMQSGIVFGYAGLIEGLVSRIQQELGEKTMVILTGGYSPLIGPETPVVDKIDPDLTLVGLRLIYEMNKE